VKWLIFWRDGDVSLWDIREWSAAQILALGNAIDVRLVPEGASSALAMVMWWRSDSA